MNTLDQLLEAARRKTQEFDEKYKLKEKLDEGMKAASDAARKGVEVASNAVNSAREQAGKVDEQFGVSEKVKAATGQAGETAQTVASEVAKNAEQAAKDVFGSAAGYYKRAEQAYNFSASSARVAEATLSGFDKARAWIKENPGKTATVTFSLIAGIRAGSALSSLGATVVGAGLVNDLLFSSALPIIGLRKLTEKYDEYLKEQEARLAKGEMDEAERASIEFQRNMTKYVGAPLLGAFSVAAGATLIGAAVSGATVTSLPLSLILGANPLLNGIWFFANGVICITEGYKFFMIALADQDEVQKVVKEIKGLLPA
ncbi:MAG: hypothetical protein U0Y68_19865 [Blastocatellia bacterium]